MMAPLFRYFSPVPGRAAPRFGTRSYIGARKTSEGFVWDEGEIVPIPVSELKLYNREYRKLLRASPRLGPALIEKTRSEYVRYAKAKGFEPIQDSTRSRTPSQSSKQVVEISEIEEHVDTGSEPVEESGE